MVPWCSGRALSDDHRAELIFAVLALQQAPWFAVASKHSRFDLIENIVALWGRGHHHAPRVCANTTACGSASGVLALLLALWPREPKRPRFRQDRALGYMTLLQLAVCAQQDLNSKLVW
uniref:Uncharacterized protein n=1 Tax=Noctiluca scintillans TaxID=2966 RepID=A0A7S1FBN4_NOCSC